LFLKFRLVSPFDLAFFSSLFLVISLSCSFLGRFGFEKRGAVRGAKRVLTMGSQKRSRRELFLTFDRR
jgi:hypothetical protein